MTEQEEFEFRHRFEQEQKTSATPASKPAGMSDAPIMDMPLAAGITPRRALGMVRGAKDIVDTGASALAGLYDKITGGSERARVDAMNKQGETDSQALIGNGFDAQASRVAGQGLMTAPIGGILGQGARLVGAAPKVVNALASNGFSLGAPAATTLAGRAGDLAIRSGAGALAGGAQVGLIDPQHAGTGAIIGGVLPGGMKLAEAAAAPVGEALHSGATRLMESALKPTLKQKQTGDAATAVQTLLDYGINPTKAGVEKIRGLIGDLNDQVSNAIAGSKATIDPQKVTNALAGVKQKFGNQVAPTADLNAIGGVEQDFLNNGGAGDIPVQLAQKLKQGTYSTLKGKYGQLGSAETEAQKGLARGLKDEIATAVPEVAPLNAEESRLLSTLTVTERRAMMDVNKNPLGLAALAVHEPTAFIAFMADKSAAFKSMAARAMNAASQHAPNINALAGPAVYRSLPRAAQPNGLLDTSRR